MKTSVILLLSLLSLSSCIKELNSLPVPNAVKSKASDIRIAPKADTIPDYAAFRLRLLKDSLNYDETMFLFCSTSKLCYDPQADGPYLQGFGQVNLASISSDGRDLAVYNLPYKQGMKIGVDVNARADGPYVIDIDYQRQIPANLQIWLKDAYLKDSVNLSNTRYNFNITTADTNSFGKRRFSLVIRENPGQHQNVMPH
ncbi:MAG: hypothetical protein JST19_15265 [Bacteroidetes bacterium]|nr:hypothetical protein [Bacteroidota bacterium]